jgi:hypothetical protein
MMVGNYKEDGIVTCCSIENEPTLSCSSLNVYVNVTCYYCTENKPTLSSSHSAYVNVTRYSTENKPTLSSSSLNVM